jgi:tetratricopeptide (TPR) repeat protein
VSAEAAYKQAMVFEPGNREFKLGLVKSYMGLNNLDAAAAMLDELLQQFPELDKLWALQANVYVQQKRPEKAIVNLEILRRMDKAAPQQLALLGDLYMTLEHPDLALSAYMAALDKGDATEATRGLRPSEILVSRGAFDEAQQLLAKIRGLGRLSGDDELKLLKLEARVALATGRSEQAIGTLEQIIERNPLDGEALLLSGDYYVRQSNPEKAASRFDAAARLPSFEADALLKHAQLHVQQQRYTEAVDLLRRAQRVKPRDSVARYLERVEQVAARIRS